MCRLLGRIGRTRSQRIASVAEFDGFHDRLNRPTTLSFDSRTLEIYMQIMALKAGIPITIRQPDLDSEGFDWKSQMPTHEKDLPARAILVRLLRGFGGGDKFVFIVHRRPDGEEEVVITTRTATAKNGERLPAEFEK